MGGAVFLSLSDVCVIWMGS